MTPRSDLGDDRDASLLWPVPREDDGKWDALDGHGYGHILGYATEAECAAWIDGYDQGAKENM